MSGTVSNVVTGCMLNARFISRIVLGNFHALILFHDDKQLETVSQVVHRLVHRAISLDGTCELCDSHI